MGKSLRCILLFYFMKICFSVVPLWDFNSSAIPLLVDNKNNYTYEVFSNDFMGFKYYITKTLYLNGNTIAEENNLYLMEKYFGKTTYDDIESAYTYENCYYVCPKGRNYVHKYCENENGNIECKIYDHQIYGDWDLHCFMQHDRDDGNNYHILFIFYLGTDSQIYNYDFHLKDFRPSLNIYNGIYAYKWRITTIEDGEYSGVQMFAIVKDGENITLRDFRFTVKPGENSTYKEKTDNQIVLGEVKSHFLAFFNESNFYWINYNKSNVSDFESGYYNGAEEITKDNIKQIEINKEFKSPFEFYDDFSIDSIKFIYGNKYVYYKIHKNIDNNTVYYGIIDVVLNKIVFNTDKDIKEFKPYSGNSFLAITTDKAYKICIIRGLGYNCTESCADNEYMFDSTGYNQCGKGCDSNIILKPNDICIDICDTTIYNIINEKECWLCKDIYDNKKYKILNTSVCVEGLLEKSYVVNQNLYLIDCIENYKYDEITKGCIPSKCYNNCLSCSDYSENKDSQKCTECNDDFVLQGENCVSECLENYFINNKKCEKCDVSCKTCSNSNSCDTCFQGEFLNPSTLKCDICSEECETCSMDKENCTSCNKDKEFKYFFNFSCVVECPENYKNDSFICLEINDNNNGQKENKDDSKIDKFLLIFLIIAGILLLLIIFCCIRRFCCRKKDSTEKLMEEINTELIESKKLVDE